MALQFRPCFTLKVKIALDLIIGGVNSADCTSFVCLRPVIWAKDQVAVKENNSIVAATLLTAHPTRRDMKRKHGQRIPMEIALISWLGALRWSHFKLPFFDLYRYFGPMAGWFCTCSVFKNNVQVIQKFRIWRSKTWWPFGDWFTPPLSGSRGRFGTFFGACVKNDKMKLKEFKNLKTCWEDHRLVTTSWHLRWWIPLQLYRWYSYPSCARKPALFTALNISVCFFSLMFRLAILCVAFVPSGAYVVVLPQRFARRQSTPSLKLRAATSSSSSGASGSFTVPVFTSEQAQTLASQNWVCVPNFLPNEAVSNLRADVMALRKEAKFKVCAHLSTFVIRLVTKDNLALYSTL